MIRLIKWVVFFGLLIFCLTSKGQCLKMDLIVLADFSGSVQGYEQKVSEASQAFAVKLNDPLVRIGYTLFNDIPYDILHLSNDPGLQAKAVDLIGNITAGGGTQLAQSMIHAGNLLLKDRFDARKMLVIISDGDPNSKTASLLAASQIKETGVMICTITINTETTRESNYNFMYEISTLCSVVTDYDNLIETIKSLELCL